LDSLGKEKVERHKEDADSEIATRKIHEKGLKKMNRTCMSGDIGFSSCTKSGDEEDRKSDKKNESKLFQNPLC
jgi:hypothetical protein